MKTMKGFKAVTEDQLIRWGHEGTVDSAKKIKEFREKNEDEELEDYAKLAYDEAIYSAYSPSDDAEERDFLLGRMIHRAEARMCVLFVKKFPLMRRIAEGEIERDIHEKVLRRAPTEQKVGWQYNFCQDYYTWEAGRLTMVEEEAEYLEAWLKQARTMFKLDKYRDAPSEIYERIHADDRKDPFEGEGEFDE